MFSRTSAPAVAWVAIVSKEKGPACAYDCRKRWWQATMPAGPIVNPILRVALALSLSVFAANAAPVFRNPLPIRHSAEWVSDLLSADFNNDGYEDVLVVASHRSLTVLLSNGAGPFAAAIKR